WAFLFALLSAITVPFYCISRRTWKPFLYVFGGISAVSFLWSFFVGFIDGLVGSNYQNNSIALLILYASSVAITYLCGYHAVSDIQKSAIEILRGNHDQVSQYASTLEATSPQSNATRAISVASRIRALKRPNKIFAITTSAVVLLTSAYAIYTTAVEATIKSNPVLAAVAATGTTIQIKHFNCGDTYGYYDSGSDTLEVCTAVHDDQLFSSKESTIRHEAWHLVQACSSIKKKNDPWGNLVLVDTPLLTGKTLSSDEEKYIAENYELESHKIESEALLAETYLTDGQIIQAIEKKCNFSG
ncbi:MAG: hypothetical protein VKM97_07835, partial [Cyanobacteriota bacterium]|nr:hypothetical protein [Cyanobacteriota bacterium]